MNVIRLFKLLACFATALGLTGVVSAATATLTTPSSTYSANGGTVTFTLTFTPGLSGGQTLSTLGEVVTLPAGWSMANDGSGNAVIGGTNPPTIPPLAGDTLELNFAYITPPSAT